MSERCQVVELPPGGLEVAAEITAISSEPGSIHQQAEHLLEPLRRLVPFCLGRISMPHPDVRDRHLLVSYGSQDPVSAYFNSPAVVRDIQLIGLDRPHPPMCLRDLPVSPYELTGWVHYLWPAGLQDGLAVGLFAPDGRHLGIMSLYTDSVGHPTAAARDLIGALAPVLAHAVDPLRSITTLATLVHGAASATVLTRTGGTMPVPGLATHPLFAENAPLLAVAARQVAAGRSHTAFLCPDPDPVSGHLRVTVLACPQERPFHLTALVLISAAGDIAGLTARELEVLGLLIEGWTDSRIAASLAITKRTVAAHVEHVRMKLGVGNRTAAAARAVRAGLYVPRGLAAGPMTAASRVRTGRPLEGRPASG